MRLSPDERERVFLAVADERRSIAALIDGLDPQQLAAASLCVGWDVKTVAAHLISDFTDGFWGFLASGVRHGSIDREMRTCPSPGMCPSRRDCRNLRREADHRLSPPVTRPLLGLTDVLVHGADMRIPLGITHRPDPQRVARVIDFLTARRSWVSSRDVVSAVSRFMMRTPGKPGAMAN